MNEFIELIGTTRAIRRYRPESIPVDDLQEMFWAATRAPSGSNRQGFHFVVVTDGPAAEQAKELLGETFRRFWAEKRVSDGYEKGVATTSFGDASSLDRELTPKERMAATMQHFVDNIETAPVLVLACLKRHRAAHPTEGSSVYPAVQNLLLAARALGYGGVITQWHGAVEEELKSMMGIPSDVAIHAVIPIGRPVGSGHGSVRRRPMNELVSLNGWGIAPEWAVDPEGTRFTQAGPPRTPIVPPQ